MNARQKLVLAQQRTGSLLSVGLEPSVDYLPWKSDGNLQDHEEFLTTIIDATRDLVPAYKVNLAFFEALGWEGIELLHAIRERIPEDTILIADAKRSDIGTSARQYARAHFDQLGADAITVNPLMGHDSVEPFLEYSDKLTFLLALTSNSGAEDFLLKNGLYLEIAAAALRWAKEPNVGLVTGATRPSQLADIRRAAGPMPFLVPGLGAQGGDLDGVLRHGLVPGEDPCMVLHVTRGILPAKGERGDHSEAIRQKTIEWNKRINDARNRVNE